MVKVQSSRAPNFTLYWSGIVKQAKLNYSIKIIKETCFDIIKFAVAEIATKVDQSDW